MILFLWFFIGLIGAIIIHISSIRFKNQYQEKERSYCPSPLEIIVGFCISFLGILTFFISIVFIIIYSDDIFTGKKWYNWMKTPICKKKN